jgi:hypothetical protein
LEDAPGPVEIVVANTGITGDTPLQMTDQNLESVVQPKIGAHRGNRQAPPTAAVVRLPAAAIMRAFPGGAVRRRSR